MAEVTRLTKVAPAGTSTNTITTGTFTANLDHLLLFFGMQCSANMNIASVGISNTHTGLSFTPVYVQSPIPIGSLMVTFGLWKAVGNGAAGTVTISNALASDQSTDVRGYAFTNSNALDLDVGSGAGYVTDTGTAPFSLPTTSPKAASHSMGLQIVPENSGEVTIDAVPGWTTVHEFDSANAAAPCSYAVVEKKGSHTAFEFNIASGTDTAMIAIGAAAAFTLVRKTDKVYPSRGARMHNNWF